MSLGIMTLCAAAQGTVICVVYSDFLVTARWGVHLCVYVMGLCVAVCTLVPWGLPSVCV